MSVIPLGFEGESLRALVVGGGRVGTRRTLSLLESGARVRVIAPVVSPDLVGESTSNENLSVERREYAGASDIGDANLVVAATESRAINECVARDAESAGIAINVADAPEKGTFVFLAVHRSGPITIGVSAGGVPSAAGRIRDSIAGRVDLRYAEAVTQCSEIRDSALASGESARWREAAADLIDETFCASIENGTFAERAARWR